MAPPFHRRHFTATRSRFSGLSPEEARARLEREGSSEIWKGAEISPLRIFLPSFQDPLIYLLLLAFALSLLIGSLPESEPSCRDALLIPAILLANGIFGFIQDFRAEKTIQVPRDLPVPDATALRDGKKQTVSSRDLVREDVLALDQGDRLPADARLIEAQTAAASESPLTGESAKVPKQTESLPSDTPLGEPRDGRPIPPPCVVPAVFPATGIFPHDVTESRPGNPEQM